MLTRVTQRAPQGYGAAGMGEYSRGVGPLELELDLLLVPLPLVLDVELGTGGHVNPLPGNLYLEPFSRLQRIGEPSKLRHELRGRVDLLDVPVWLFVQGSSRIRRTLGYCVAYRVGAPQPSWIRAMQKPCQRAFGQVFSYIA